MIAENYRITPYQTWQIASAIRLHFNDGDYDAFKFNFKVPGTQRAFESRRDRYFYEKIAKKYPRKNESIHFFMSNVISGKTWIGDMTSENYELWQNRIQSISYTFKSNISDIKSHCERHSICFDELFNCVGELPTIFKLYFSQIISIETLCILDILCNYSTHINKNESDPMGLLKETSHIVVGYKPFLLPKIDKQKYKEIVINAFTNS